MGRLDTLESSLRQARTTGPAVTVSDIPKETCKEEADTVAADSKKKKPADKEIVNGGGPGGESDRIKRRLLKQVFDYVEDIHTKLKSDTLE